MATNLALQLQVIEPDTDLNSIMIGNSRYSADVWDLRPFITTKSTKESHKYIHFEYIYYIQQQADMLSAEISKLMRKDADLSEKHLNELIQLGVFISMTCQELLDEE